MEPPSCCGEEQQDAGPSMERAFEGEPVPSRSETITARSVAVSVVLGVTLSVVAMKLSLTSGFLPTLAIPAGLLGFFLSRAWVRLADRLELAQLPFTRQENTVVQTCVVACSCIAYTGGFGSYILAMSKNAAEGGVGSDALNVEEPKVGRLIAFLFLTNFAGLFAILPFRDYFIMRHNLAFPSGTATAHLINTVHTPHGAKQARKQVSALFKTFAGTIAWSAFQWFFSGGDGTCGFQAFPAFGLAAFRLGFYFDFSMANVGVGMLSPYKITVSMLTGSLFSWALLWPHIEAQEGVWYPKGLDEHNLSGINGYRVFTGISMILADGLVHLLCILVRTLRAMHSARRQRHQPFQRCLSAVEYGGLGGGDQRTEARSFDDRRRAQVFLRDRVSNRAAALSAVAVALIPRLYPQLGAPPRGARVPGRARARLLQRVRERRHGHARGRHVRQDRHARVRVLGRGRPRRRGGRARRRRHLRLRARTRRRPHAGVQDRAPDPHPAAHRARRPARGHGARVRGQPGRLLGLLQALLRRRRRRRARRRAVRQAVPRHRHAGLRRDRAAPPQRPPLPGLLRRGAGRRRARGAVLPQHHRRGRGVLRLAQARCPSACARGAW